MSNRTRSTLSPKFRVGAAKLGVNQGHSIRDVTEAMAVVKKTFYFSVYASAKLLFLLSEKNGTRHYKCYDKIHSERQSLIITYFLIGRRI
ncbi:hypothetical protein [Zhongshania aquimaris]|uniref:Transposase n=1 Tax=Zhongshania aquimaris TaxID=2857107 RepID=A0ABS6VVL7_9GAMM|nr:hypothetical protein [Zhongshania aquimaris]MBW2942384.1 hypothetical protein [Zhongshania aquimaris]